MSLRDDDLALGTSCRCALSSRFATGRGVGCVGIGWCYLCYERNWHADERR